MRYYILDTIEESEQCLEECYIAMMNNVSNQSYKSQTSAWAFEQQRLTDGKFIVPVCPHLGTFGYNIETSTEDWFEEPDSPL